MAGRSRRWRKFWALSTVQLRALRILWGVRYRLFKREELDALLKQVEKASKKSRKK